MTSQHREEDKEFFLEEGVSSIKLFNQDCVEGMKQLGDESVDLIITDPPFGCNATLKGDYVDDEEYIKSQIPIWVKEFARLIKDTGHVYIYVPTKYIDNWLPVVKEELKFNNILSVQNMKYGRRYKNNFRSNTQHILFCSKGRAKNFNKVDWIRTSDSWFNDKRNTNPERFQYFYPNYVPSEFKATVEESHGHRDEKNTGLLKVFVELSSEEGDLVLDPFVGSGSTAVACQATSRSFVGFEISEEYFSMGVRRLLS